MNLGAQIRRLRTEQRLSQEELAEKVFVTRQSVSNWENDRTYPDIRSLLLLSEVFSVSLDTLIKGDVEKMKMEIDGQEYARFQKDSVILAIFFAAMLLLPVPLVLLLEKWVGVVLAVLLLGAGMYYAVRVERYKKKHNIQTYKEIVAFQEGKTLSEIEKAQEYGKRPYQKVLLAAGAAVLALVISVVMGFLLT